MSCGLKVSDKAKYCRRCGFPIDVVNVSDHADPKRNRPHSAFWETSKNRLGLSGIKSILTDLRKGLRRNSYLLPVFILLTVWLIVSLLITNGVKGFFLQLLAFLTYSQGAMTGGLLGFLGGVAGKMLYVYFVVMISAPYFSLQKPFKGLKSGLQLYLLDMKKFRNIDDLNGFVLGLSLAFISYNMLSGDNSLINAIVIFPLIVILLRTLARKSGIIWDLYKRIFIAKKVVTIPLKAISAYISGLVLAVFTFAFKSAFISYYIGLALFLIYIILKLAFFFANRKRSFRKIIPLIIIGILLLSPLQSLAAPSVSEIKGVWVLEKLIKIDPETSANPKENTEVKNGYIKKHFSVDTYYDIEYFWDPPPKKIYAGNETAINIRQRMRYVGDSDFSISSQLKTSMYIVHKEQGKEEETITYFQSNRIFSSENMYQYKEEDHLVFFLKIPDYYTLYEKLNKNNCRLHISIQASFGGRVEYVYRLQRNAYDGFLTWLVGSGDLNESKKTIETLLFNVFVAGPTLLCAWISIGSLTLKKKKGADGTYQTKVKQKDSVEKIIYSPSETDYDLLHESFKDVVDAGWPKYKEVLLRTLAKEKDLNISNKDLLNIENSIDRFKNEISGLKTNLDSMGYNNDSYALKIRGDALQEANGKLVYSNYVFNSLASNTPYNALIEISNSFALKEVKAGVLASPSVHLRNVILLLSDLGNNSSYVYANMAKGKYGDFLKGKIAKKEITPENIKNLGNYLESQEGLNKLYQSISEDKLSKEDKDYLSKYWVVYTKKALKAAASQSYRYEKTSLIIKNFIEG